MILTYYLWRFLSWLATYLPLSVTDKIAGGGGTSVYYIWRSRRQVARENFAHVLGKPANDPAVGRVARSSFVNYCRYLVEIMRYPRVPMDKIEQRVVIHESEEFRRAMTGNTPVIMISAHFGNMDYASAVATRRYGHFTLAAETIHPVQLFQYLARVRAERGVYLIPYDQAPRKIIEALKRKEWIGFLIDFGVNNHKDIATTEVMFFGAPTRFPASPAILAQRTGAPIIVVHTYVDRDRRIHSVIETPIYVPKGIPRDEAARVAMQTVAQYMEKFIREHPEQWYVFRAMWPQPAKASWRQRLQSAFGSGAEI
jgi:phosphatidylinositol dimannoside acyltransferase